jgi:hypothetical protein
MIDTLSPWSTHGGPRPRLAILGADAEGPPPAASPRGEGSGSLSILFPRPTVFQE